MITSFKISDGSLGGVKLRLTVDERATSDRTRYIESVEAWDRLEPALFLDIERALLSSDTGAPSDEISVSVIVRDRGLNKFDRIATWPLDNLPRDAWPLNPGLRKFSRSARMDVAVVATVRIPKDPPAAASPAMIVARKIFEIRVRQDAQKLKSRRSGYPGLRLDVAKHIDTMRRRGSEHVDIGYLICRKAGADFDDDKAVECLQLCDDLYFSGDGTRSSHARFDAQCAPLLHAILNLPERIAGDPDFWRWLTFCHSCIGAGIIDRRYGPRTERGRVSVARPVYYGLGPMKKGMFAKLWICANLMHVDGAADPYDGIEYADVDLWDSHVIDADFASSPVMARAFVKTVRDMNLSRGDANNPDTPAGFRDLAKEISRQQAGVAFELFDEGEARVWIENLWSEQELWCYKR